MRLRLALNSHASEIIHFGYNILLEDFVASFLCSAGAYFSGTFLPLQH